jgi:hypothetical protein
LSIGVETPSIAETQAFLVQDMVSIEKVLNSRCSSGFDNSSKNSHWGTFVKDDDTSRKVTYDVLKYCKIPQFSDGKLAQEFQNEYLFLNAEKKDDPFKARLLQIESGMQQEAVYLACTALGLGACIHNLGINGTERENSIATARYLILEKENCYKTGKFSTASPGPEKPFKKGKNLSEPRRDGKVECLDQMMQLTVSEKNGNRAGEADISQLLWAARGRTPHYVKRHPWGLTIPTWGGRQNFTNVYIIKARKLFRYVNWTTNRHIDIKTRFFPWWIFGHPTHDLRYVKNVQIPFESNDASLIIMSRNEATNRALWEVGYMLENMFLQARSLGISYQTKIFTDEEARKLKTAGIQAAVTALLL